MLDYDVVDPIPLPEAFERSDEKACLSQAGFLLALGALSRPDWARLIDQDALSDDAMRLPSLAPWYGRISAPDISSALTELDLSYVLQFDSPDPRILPVLSALVQRLYEAPHPAPAAAVLAASLLHPQQLVRVAGAISYADIVDDGLSMAVPILRQGATSDDEMTRDVAFAASERLDLNLNLEGGTAGPELRIGGDDSQATPTLGTDGLIVHGSFARSSAWWKPGGDFHSYYKSTVNRALYDRPDRFGWRGGLGHAALSVAAQELTDWITARRWQDFEILSHSNGGNVTMLASQNGLNISRLVMLSCPVLRYRPNFGVIGKVISIQVKWDLVLMALRAGDRFGDTRIHEHVLPIWFDHTSTRRPATWKNYNIPTML